MKIKLYSFIENEFKKMGCKLLELNGTSNHVHCLVVLNPQKAVSDVIKQVKGASSHFINKDNILYDKFGWQTGYFVNSVSESMVDKVRGYIINQEAHHLKKSFEEEYQEFLKIHNLNG